MTVEKKGQHGRDEEESQARMESSGPWKTRTRKAPAPRALRPRATSSLSVVPALVSDLTAAAVVGLEPRQFREFLRVAGVPHAVVGRRAIARVDAVLEAVEKLSRVPDGPGDASDETTSDHEPTIDQLLARIGRRRAVP